MPKLINVADYQKAARRQLPKQVFDFLEGGAEDEICLRNNRLAFELLKFNPRRFQKVDTVNINMDIFGIESAAPLVVGPTGLNGLIWPDGDIALARACSRAGVPFVLATPSQNSIEEVANRSPGMLWFQLYPINSELTATLIRRALDNGYSALILTADVPCNGKRERDLRNRFEFPLRFRGSAALEALRHPAWCIRFFTHPRPNFANLPKSGIDDQTPNALGNRSLDATFNWEDLTRIRHAWPKKLIVKGILTGEDLRRCQKIGIDGVVLSNHGGRQLDSLSPPVEILRHMNIRDGFPIFLDGGIRRGSDIVKAVALGAQAALLGRAPLYGLAVAGEDGAFQVISLLKDEIRQTIALIGYECITELSKQAIRHANHC